MKSAADDNRNHRSLRSTLASFLAMGAVSVLLVSGLTVVAGSAAMASTTAAVAPAVPCNETISTAPGSVVATSSGALVVGVTAGTTQILIDCNAASTASMAVESSLLGGIVTSTVTASNEADLATLATFVASSTDTGCPAATAGSCTLATFKVPAAFAPADSASACPPTQAQINAGLFGCAIAVVNASLAPVPGGEFLMMYASQTNPPNDPTIAASPVTGAAGSGITVSDAPGNTKYWWGNAIQAVQAATLGTTPTAPPTTCGTGGGYGNVPSAFLSVKWYATGSTTAIVGSAAGVTISNDCYDGTTLHAPALSGTITAPSTLTPGTTYTAYLCELNATPYPSNDASATANCGAAPAGASWIDASFKFSAVAGTINQVAPTSGSVTVSGSAAFTAQLAVSGNNGTVTYNQHGPGPDLSVSTSGKVSTNRTLAAGTYTATGATSDPNGDTGTFTYTLTVGAITQAALTLTSTSGRVGTALTLTSSGGSGTGAVTYAVTSASTAGCSITGGTLSATGAGTCTVTVTKAADTTYLVASSAATTVTFTHTVVTLTITSLSTYAKAGQTRAITLSGTGFTPTVTIHSAVAGVSFRVMGVSANAVRVQITVAKGVKAGWGRLFLNNGDGRKTSKPFQHK
jgi:hypothetical protein